MTEDRTKIRIILLGAVDFSAHCLATLLTAGAKMVAVLGLDRNMADRHTDFADLEPVARDAGIPYRAIRSVNDEATLQFLREVRPDLLMVLGWSEILKRSVLEIPKMGTIGSHPTLLPANRGHHPTIWTLVHGLEQGGVTLFWMSERVDQGAILAQRAFPIALVDDAASVYAKVKTIAADLLKETLPLLNAGHAARIPQDESRSTYWRKRWPKDGEIRWDVRTRDIYNLIRALTRPYPGAIALLGDQEITVWKAEEVKSPPTGDDASPGTVLAVSEERVRVRTGDGAIDLVRWEGVDCRLNVGDRLE